jgi:hypothetical protein
VENQRVLEQACTSTWLHGNIWQQTSIRDDTWQHCEAECSANTCQQSEAACLRRVPVLVHGEVSSAKRDLQRDPIKDKRDLQRDLIKL